jgi:hypothetical protein
MSFYSMAIPGVTPFGSLIAGIAASCIGAPHTLMIGGAICVGGSALFASQLPALRKVIRPIYVQIGIIPEGAAGIGAASAMQQQTKE